MTSLETSYSLLNTDEEEVINETWILEKPITGDGGWLLAGIKQNDEG